MRLLVGKVTLHNDDEQEIGINLGQYLPGRCKVYIQNTKKRLPEIEDDYCFAQILLFWIGKTFAQSGTWATRVVFFSVLFLQKNCYIVEMVLQLFYKSLVKFAFMFACN